MKFFLSPRTHGVCSRAVRGERKENLADEIRAGINDKRTYAIERLYELMCGGGLGVHRLDLNRWRLLQLRPDPPQGLLPQARVEIFYCGSHEIEREGAIVLWPLPRASKAETVSTDVRIQPVKETPRVFTDKMEVTKANSPPVRLGRRCWPNYPALMVFNAVYGGAASATL